jgi:hypothetical protein
MVHEFDDESPKRINSLKEIDEDVLWRKSIALDKGEDVPEPIQWERWNLEDDRVGNIASFDKGAEAVYTGEFDHSNGRIQVREYSDRYLIQRDHADPTENPVEHYQLDVSPDQRTGLTLLGVGVAVVAGKVILDSLGE